MRPTRRKAGRPVVAALLLMMASPLAARAQAVDCTGLRSQIEAARAGVGPSRFDAAIRQQQAEIERTQAYADDSGCGGTSFFDAADPQQCRMLARRVQALRSGLQRLQGQASQDDPDRDERRRGLVEQYNAYCAGMGDEAPGYGGPAIVPVDPGSGEDAAPAPRARFARVLCVRQCDGAYYPLAVDVSPDRLDGMDKVCKAQCPNAESSAYTTGQDDDVAKAVAADGSTYGSMAAAFKFRTGVTAGCACRAPHQSWAEALAEADSLLEAHKGDVTVTPEVAAAMSRPIQPPAAPVKGAGGKAPAKKAAASAVAAPPPLVVSPPRGMAPAIGPDASTANPGEDVTRQFRRSAPTL